MKEQRDHKYWMGKALVEAKAAALAGEVPVGAIIVIDEECVATGGNAMISGSDPTAHAEIVALRAACKSYGNYRLPTATLYVTLEPCTMCMGALVHARVEKVVFGAFDFKTGAAGSLFSFGDDGSLNHRIEVEGGVCEEECSGMLKNFFKMRRKQKAEKTKASKESCDKS